VAKHFITKAVTMEYLELVPQFISVAGVCVFLIYRDRSHDDRLTRRITKLEDGLANVIVPMVERCTNVIPTDMPDAGRRP
jgi:hypothetical protein